MYVASWTPPLRRVPSWGLIATLIHLDGIYRITQLGPRRGHDRIGLDWREVRQRNNHEICRRRLGTRTRYAGGGQCGTSRSLAPWGSNKVCLTDLMMSRLPPKIGRRRRSAFSLGIEARSKPFRSCWLSGNPYTQGTSISREREQGGWIYTFHCGKDYCEVLMNQCKTWDAI